MAGNMDEAGVAFEASAATAASRGYWLLEALALCDLKKHILDADGRGDEGTQRLRTVLQKMKGPPAELTKLLGEGLDAEEILHVDDEYVVVDKPTGVLCSPHVSNGAEWLVPLAERR